MENKIRKKRRAFVNANDCVACGCCAKVCPRNAIEIWNGIMAKVDFENALGAENAKPNVRHPLLKFGRYCHEKALV